MSTNTRITTDLGDPKLLQLVKWEAQQTNTSIREVVVKALQAYFTNRLELNILQKASEKVFEEWDNPQDAEYDKL